MLHEMFFTTACIVHIFTVTLAIILLRKAAVATELLVCGSWLHVRALPNYSIGIGRIGESFWCPGRG